MASAATTTAASALSKPILSHSSCRWAFAGWTFFIAENAILSENRTWLINELGDDMYHGVYGTLSTIATGSIGYAYYKFGKTTFPRELLLRKNGCRPPLSTIGVGWMCLSLGLIMASQAAPKLQIPIAMVSTTDDDSSSLGKNATVGPRPSKSNSTSTKFQVRCPFDFADKRSDPSSQIPQGTERISRHPGLWAFGFVGIGQAMLAPTIPQRIWWCGPTAVAWLGGWHTDSRFRRGMGGTLSAEYQSQTSNIPFWAMLSGQQGTSCWRALWDDIKPLNAGFAIGMSTLWVLRRVR